MNNNIISGSLGNISKPIVAGLVKAGKQVTVITSSADKVKEIESLGAKAAVGSITDVPFLTSVFTGAEVVYTMIPPIWITSNWRESQREMATSYEKAITDAKVKHVVNLSSIGAHLPEGAGPVSGIHEFENKLNAIPGINVIHLRAGYFYLNLFNQIGMIKNAGIMGGNFGAAGNKIPLVHPKDIAEVALEELLSLNFKGTNVRNVLGDLRDGTDIARTLGKAVGRDFPWVVFSDKDQKDGFIGAGLSQTHADGYLEMGVALRNGKFQEDLVEGAIKFTPTKLENFAAEFGKAFGG